MRDVKHQSAPGDVSVREFVGLPLAADRWVMLAVTVLMTAPLTVAIVAGEVEAFALFFLAVFYILVYYPFTAIALRAARLRGFVRHFFCFTAVPVFVVLLVVSVALLFGYFPILEQTFASSQAAGGPKAGIGHAALASIGAAVLFWLWYMALRLLDAFIHARTKSPG